MNYICVTLFLNLFNLFLSDCIPNKNCLENTGKCINNICKCYEGYWTLNTKEVTNIYCSYKRISRYIPLILEIPGLGIGHFYVGNIKKGIFKFFLLAFPIISILIGYRSYKNEKINEKSNNESKNEEELNLINNENKNENLKLNQEDKNKKENYFSDEGSDNGNLSFRLHQANHSNEPIPGLKFFFISVVVFLLICYILMYTFDIIGYGFALYYDGENVPLL